MDINPYQPPLFARLELSETPKRKMSRTWFIWNVQYLISILFLLVLVLTVNTLWPDIPKWIDRTYPYSVAHVGLCTFITILFERN